MILKNKWLILNLLILMVIVSHSITRDLHLEKQYPADLRNRVVGARLQKDGKLPYFFHWKQADYPRYADPFNSQDSTLPASMITASPFFHELLRPICEFPQRNISIFWLWLQYFLLAMMIWMTCRLTGSKNLRLLILNVGILFTLTEAWISLIMEGQLYFIVAFLYCCFITTLLYNRAVSWILGGISVALLILIRPTAIVLFIPFLFYWRKYLLFLITAFVALGIYGLFVLTNHSEKLLWQNYQMALKQQVRIHQCADPAELWDYRSKSDMPYLEGFDFKEVDQDFINHQVPHPIERGCLFVIYQNITHHKIPLPLLNALNLCSILVLSSLFFYFGRNHKVQLFQILSFGFILYESVELFGPITRYPYYVVQWLPILLIAFLYSTYLNRGRTIFVLLICGLLLNILTVRWIYLRHTLGELTWLAALLLITFTDNSSSQTPILSNKPALE